MIQLFVLLNLIIISQCNHPIYKQLLNDLSRNIAMDQSHVDNGFKTNNHNSNLS